MWRYHFSIHYLLVLLLRLFSRRLALSLCCICTFYASKTDFSSGLLRNTVIWHKSEAVLPLLYLYSYLSSSCREPYVLLLEDVNKCYSYVVICEWSLQNIGSIVSHAPPVTLSHFVPVTILLVLYLCFMYLLMRWTVYTDFFSNFHCLLRIFKLMRQRLTISAWNRLHNEKAKVSGFCVS